MNPHRSRATRGSEQSRRWIALPSTWMILDGGHNVEREKGALHWTGKQEAGIHRYQPPSFVLCRSLKQDLLHTPARRWRRRWPIAHANDELGERFANDLREPGA
jgi:hypothetical protein